MMILNMLMNLCYTILNLLTFPIDIPNLPATLYDVSSEIVSYIGVGLGIFSCYTDYEYLIGLLLLVLGVDLGLRVYYVAMFIIKKIPLLNIK